MSSEKPAPPPVTLATWDRLKTPPPTALKKISGGRLKGMSDINPQWRYQALTAEYGPCGIGWKYQIAEKWTEPGPEGQVFCFVIVHLFVRRGEAEWSEAIPAFGGSMLVEAEHNGLHASDEAYKMATTDALGTAAKMLGVAADVYLGLQDSKYSNGHGAEATEKPSKPAAKAASDWPEAESSAAGGTNWKGQRPNDPDEPECPECGGGMWDNREPERGGKGKFAKKTPKAPDFKCRKKDCDGAYWPASGHKAKPSKPASKADDEYEYSDTDAMASGADEVPF
jgi:hypothetical protein